MELKISLQKKFVVNGKEYRSLEEMPESIRQAFEKARSAEGNAEGWSAQEGRSSKITINGQTYSSPEEMPADVRELYERVWSATQGTHRQALSSSQGEGSVGITIESAGPGRSRWLALAVGAMLLLVLLACLAHGLFTGG